MELLQSYIRHWNETALNSVVWKARICGGQSDEPWVPLYKFFPRFCELVDITRSTPQSSLSVRWIDPFVPFRHFPVYLKTCLWLLRIYQVPGLPSVTEFQYFVTEITLLLLKFSWNFGQNTEICLNFSVVSTQKYWNVGRIMQKYWNYCNLLLKWVCRVWQPCKSK